MKRKTKIILSGVIAIVLLSATWGPAKRHVMHKNELILVPEPTLGRFVFGGYSLDREATEAHYNALFKGKSAEEVVRFLEERDEYIFYYEDPNRIGILLERLVSFFYYRMKINFHFRDGMFLETKVWGGGVK